MKKELCISGIHNLYLQLWYQECGLLGRGCDLLLSGVDDAMLERLRDLGSFGRIMRYTFFGDGEWSLCASADRVRESLANRGRTRRVRHRFHELLNPGVLLGEGPIPYTHFWDPMHQIKKEASFLYPLHEKDGLTLCFWEHSLFYYEDEEYQLYHEDHFEGVNALWQGLAASNGMDDRAKEYYVFRPELLSERFRRKDARIVKVPFIDHANSRYLDRLNHLYRYDGNHDAWLAGTKCVILNSYGNAANEIPAEVASVYDMAIRHMGAGNTAIKHHPRSHKTGVPMFAGWEEVRETAANKPFEFFVANHGPIDDMLLISGAISVAVFSPKLIFDYEPYILCFGACFPELFPSELVDKTRAFMNRFRRIYRRPEKILFAETVEEIETFLRGITAK